MAEGAGACTANAVDLSAGASYTIIENDFMAVGGDGYPNFSSRATSLNILDNVVAEFKTLPEILSATTNELDMVEGIGEVRAKMIKEGLRRLREQVLLDRHI